MTLKEKKIKEAKEILKAFGLPASQQNEISALTLLALCDIKPNTPWRDAVNKSKKVTKDIMAFVRDVYKFNYAPNTRETFRRQVLHQFELAGIINYNPDKPDLPVNSPNAHYALTESALRVIRQYGSKNFLLKSGEFAVFDNKLMAEANKDRTGKLIPVVFENKYFKLSPGKHNILEVAIINEFAPRFAQNSKVLYLGDTQNKNLYFNELLLERLKIPFDKHSKLPDVVLYLEEKKWLYLIEAVTSHGPVTPKRVLELEKLLKDCSAGKIYVSAFPDIAEFKRHASEIAWETEVWISGKPGHLIHFNGDKFLGPRNEFL